MTTKTHDQLINAAMTLFAANDYGNVTTRKIVAEAGVALPTLHRHFDTKENLFRAMVKETYQRLDGIRDTLLDQLSEADDHRQIIEAAIRTFLEFAVSDPRPLRVLVRMSSDPTAPRDQYTESRDQFLNYMVELFPSKLPTDELRLRLQFFLLGFSRLVTADRQEICAIAGKKSWKETRPILEEMLIQMAYDTVQLTD